MLRRLQEQMLRASGNMALIRPAVAFAQQQYLQGFYRCTKIQLVNCLAAVDTLTRVRLLSHAFSDS